MSKSKASNSSKAILFLSAPNRQELLEQISRIDQERVGLKEKLLNEFAKEKKSLAGTRLELQKKRTAAGPAEDPDIASKIYENILTESNLKARMERQLADFDQKNSVALTFSINSEGKFVDSITIGRKTMWMDSDELAHMIAKQ